MRQLAAFHGGFALFLFAGFFPPGWVAAGAIGTAFGCMLWVRHARGPCRKVDLARAAAEGAVLFGLLSPALVAALCGGFPRPRESGQALALLACGPPCGALFGLAHGWLLAGMDPRPAAWILLEGPYGGLLTLAAGGLVGADLPWAVGGAGLVVGSFTGLTLRRRKRV